jgi:hypothetical protein
MIPDEIIETLERELRDLVFGAVKLEIIVHDRRPRFVISRECSIIPGKPSSGAPGITINTARPR